MSRKKSIKKNYVYNLIYQLITIAIPLITTPYLSRVLGAESIGIFSYTLSIVTYFVLFGSLGVATYGRREIAYSRDDSTLRSKVFWEIILIRCITIAISFVVFLIVVLLSSDYKIYFMILSVELFATIFDISWLFQGVEDFKVTVLRVVIVKVLGAVAIFMFVNNQNDLWVYMVIYAVSILLGNLSLWIHLKKYVKWVSIRMLSIKKHIKPVFALFLPQIASQVYVVLDKVMIGAMIEDKSELGFYDQGEKIIKILLTIITALSTVMVPKIASAFIEKDHKKMDEYMIKTFRFTYLLGFPMIFGVLVASDSFVPIFFGDGFDKVSIVMKMLSPIILVIGFGSAIGVQYLIPVKRQRELTISYVIGAVVNVVSNALMIVPFGMIGAIIGTIFAETCVTGFQMWCIRKEYRISRILRLAGKYFVASIIMFGVCWWLSNVVGKDILGIIVLVLVGGISYVAVLVVLKEELIIDFFNRILKWAKNKFVFWKKS